jgi:hypothetical protein
VGRPVVDKTGARFGRLVVLRMLPRNQSDPVLFECDCDCGNTKIALSSRLGRGTASCGCLRRGHARTVPVADRFWEKVSVTGDPSDCWEWTGAIDPQTGYGRIGAFGSSPGAHRVSYELAHEFVPDGMLVCHTCDNRKCVNPGHLYVGTYSDNIRDAYRRTRRSV